MVESRCSCRGAGGVLQRRFGFGGAGSRAIVCSVLGVVLRQEGWF